LCRRIHSFDCEIARLEVRRNEMLGIGQGRPGEEILGAHSGMSGIISRSMMASLK
jgi:hypothetical protein